MQHNTDKQTATACQKTPEIASINGQLLEEIKHYKAHADKLAEALRAWEYARNAGGISMVDWFEVARKKTREALAAYDQQSRGESLRESEAAQ